MKNLWGNMIDKIGENIRDIIKNDIESSVDNHVYSVILNNAKHYIDDDVTTFHSVKISDNYERLKYENKTVI